MNSEDRPDMQEWEAQIEALLDGELSDAEAEALKSAAERDQALARAIIEAYQLQQAIAALPREPAPASLRRKLRRIPREQRKLERPAFPQLRWAAALAAFPLVLYALTQLAPKQPSPAEIAQARHDLAVAFSYLEKASRATGREIESTIDDEMNSAVTDKVFKSIEQGFNLDKEHKA